jgi:hypothetical protein
MVINYLLESSVMLQESSIMFIELSIILLELSVMFIENIYSTGMIVISL